MMLPLPQYVLAAGDGGGAEVRSGTLSELNGKFNVMELLPFGIDD